MQTRWTVLVLTAAVFLSLLSLQLPLSVRPVHAPAAPVDVASYDIQVTLDPAQKMLIGRERLTYVNVSSDALLELPFHLYLNAFSGPDTVFMQESGGQARGYLADLQSPGWIRVDAIELAGQSLLERLAYNHDATVMTVTLPAPLLPGASLNLDLAFQAQLPRVFARTGWADDDFFMVGQWFPKIARYDASGWHAWPFHAKAEFYADFGMYDVAITLPAGFVVGATGLSQGSLRNPDGSQTLKFHADHVIDFAWTASPHYRRIVRQVGDIELELLYQPENWAYVERYVTAATQALEFLAEKVGPYMYPRLTVVDTPSDAPGAGGMEYPMLVTGGIGALGFSELPGGRMYEVEVVTLHEVTHNWFGMVVATNEAEEPWLDEALPIL